jgi:hypothetical protein
VPAALTHRDEEEARAVARLSPDGHRTPRRWAALTAVGTAVAAMVLGLPLGGSVPTEREITVAVSPAVRAYLPGSAAR